MSTIRVVNIQHSDATEPNIVLEADGTATFVSGITISGGTNLTVSGTAEFASGTVSAPGITFIDDNNTGIYEPAADTVAITTAATERLRVDNSGNVAIGGTTITDSNLLNIQGSSATKNIGIVLNDTNTSKIFGIQNGGSSLKFFDYTASAERMRIDSIGNVGIGNTAPGAKLQIEGTSDQLKLTYTSIASYIHEVHSNGDYSVSKDSSERMRIDSSGTLTVGPQYDRLNVNPGSGSYDGDPTSVVIDGRTNDGNATAFKIDRFDGSGNASTKFFVNYAGNVGIGTTSPIAILNTSVNTPDGLGLYMENRADAGTDDKIGLAFVLRRAGGYAFNQTRIRAIKENAWTGTPSTINSALTFSTYSAESAAERMRIDSSGRLLVGTSSSLSTLAFQPNFQVEGNGAATSSGSFLRTSNDVNPSYIGLCKKRGSGGNVSNGDNIGRLMFMAFDGVNFLEAASINSFVDGVVNTQNDMPARLVFSTTQDGSNSPTERMRIDDEGIIYYNSSNHGIGTFLTQSAGTTKYAFRGHHSTSAGSYGGTISFTVWSNGNVENTNNSYGAISDIKLKENIVDANSQWNDLKALQVRNYNFKEGQTHTQIGLVAQEAELISPGLVYESPDLDEEGNDLGTITKSVNYSVLYMKAVKALQEAMERIETLEAKVAALEAS